MTTRNTKFNATKAEKAKLCTAESPSSQPSGEKSARQFTAADEGLHGLSFSASLQIAEVAKLQQLLMSDVPAGLSYNDTVDRIKLAQRCRATHDELQLQEKFLNVQSEVFALQVQKIQSQLKLLAAYDSVELQLDANQNSMRFALGLDDARYARLLENFLASESGHIGDASMDILGLHRLLANFYSLAEAEYTETINYFLAAKKQAYQIQLQGMWVEFLREKALQIKNDIESGMYNAVREGQSSDQARLERQEVVSQLHQLIEAPMARCMTGFQ